MAENYVMQKKTASGTVDIYPATTASNVSLDAVSGLSATDVQGAIEEIVPQLNSGSGSVFTKMSAEGDSNTYTLPSSKSYYKFALTCPEANELEITYYSSTGKASTETITLSSSETDTTFNCEVSLKYIVQSTSTKVYILTMYYWDYTGDTLAYVSCTSYKNTFEFITDTAIFLGGICV